MSWLYSQALAEEYLGENCLDGGQSVQSSGTNTQVAYLSPDKMTKFSRLSRYGMTCKPLTEDRGEELLTLYLGAFRAKIYLLQGKEKELTENVQDSGGKCPELLARLDPNTSLWKIPQCSLFEDSTECLQTLPRWGMTVNGELFQRQTLVHPIKENESGLWLTPSTVDIPTRSQESMEKRFKYRESIGRNGVGAGCLAEQVSWSGDGKPINYVTKETFPTPNAWDGKRGPMSKELMESGKHQITLVTHIRHSVQTPPNGGQLNPSWVEWLMGWPIGWTDLKPLEMDKSHYVQQQPGES